MASSGNQLALSSSSSGDADLHPASSDILAIIRCLPGESHLEEMLFASRLPTHKDIWELSGDDRRRVLHEVFMQTNQLTVFRSKMGDVVDALRAVLITPEVCAAVDDPAFFNMACYRTTFLLEFLSARSMKGQRALVSVELLSFIKYCALWTSICSQHTIGMKAVRCLNVMWKHQARFLEETLVEQANMFVGAMVDILYRETLGAADVGADERREDVVTARVSLCQTILDLHTSLLRYSSDEALAALRVPFREHMWPVMQQLLRWRDASAHWWRAPSRSERALHKYQEVQEAIIARTGQQISLTQPPCFMEKVPMFLSELSSCGIIEREDFHPALMVSLAQLLCNPLCSDACKTTFEKLPKSISTQKRFNAERRRQQASLVAIRETQADMYAHHVFEFAYCGNQNCDVVESPAQKFSKCSGCNIERFCSQACQKKAWKAHKPVCLSLRRSLPQ